jgi:hypothetical protein
LRRIAHWLDAPVSVAEAERADWDGRAGLVLRSDAARWFMTGLDADHHRAFGLRIAGEEATLGRVDLRIALLDAPEIVTDWEPGPLRADLRDAGVLIESVKRGDDPREIWWRGGSAGAIPDVSRIEQIWEYERDELDNADVVIVPEAAEYLDLPPVASLQWLSVSEEAAREYGDAHPVFLRDPVVLLRDGHGGILVAEREDLERARNRNRLSPEAASAAAPPAATSPGSGWRPYAEAQNSKAKRSDPDISRGEDLQEATMDEPMDDAVSLDGEDAFAEENSLGLDSDDLGDLDTPQEPAVAKVPWVVPILNEGGLFPPFLDQELPPIAGTPHGVLPTQWTVAWELQQDRRMAAKVLVARARDGKYRHGTEIALSDRMQGGLARATDASGYATLAEAVAAARTEILETLKRWHEGERSGQKAAVLQRLAGLVATEPEGTRQLTTLEDQEMPEALAHMAVLRAKQREDSGLALHVRWGVTHQPPRFTVAISAEDAPTVRAMDDRGTVLAEAVFDPLNTAEWLFFVDRIPVADPADADLLRNYPYGLGNDPVLQLNTPLRAQSPARPALIWPEDPETADLPIENGPFPLGNMDRFVALRWENEHGGRVQMAIGRSPAGYHSQLLIRMDGYTTADLPNVRTSGEGKRPARARFAEALADLHQDWKRRFKRESEYGLGVDHAELYQSVNDELAGRVPAIRAERLGVDGADLVHRDLEGVRTLEIGLCTFSRGRNDPETVAHGTGWTLVGVTEDGTSRHLGSDIRWERIVQAQAAAFARMSSPQELGAVPVAPAATEAAATASVEASAVEMPIAQTPAEAATEAKPVILRHHALAPQLVSKEPVEVVREIGETGVSGTLEGFSEDFGVMRLSGVWYRHPLVDHWLQSRFFQKSGWSDAGEILRQVFDLKGQEIRLERMVRGDGPLKGVGQWRVFRGDEAAASISEPHLAQQGRLYRQALSDAEALRLPNTTVVLDLHSDQRVEAFVRSPADHALVVEIAYFTATQDDSVQRRVQAHWNDAGGERGMDIPLHEDANRHPVVWVQSLRPSFPEFEQKAVAQRQAIDELESHLRRESRRVVEDLAAVSVAPVTDQASLHAYIQELSAITDAMHQGVRERMRHLEKDLGVPGSDPRLQILYQRPSYQAFIGLDDRVAELREAAEKKAERETRERGKRLLNLLPDDASPEDIAQAVFLAHGIETRTVPPIVEAIRERNVDRVQSLIGHNSQNPASQEVFERLTGIKLGSTQAARARQIDEWAGLSEADRKRMEDEKQAARDREKWLAQARSAWQSLGRMQVRTPAGIVDGHTVIREQAQRGFTKARLAEYPDAAGRTRYEDRIENPETGEFYRLKSRDFREFVTALVRGGFDPERRVLESLTVLAAADQADEAETGIAAVAAASAPALAVTQDEPVASVADAHADDSGRVLEDLGFVAKERKSQGDGWVQEYHLPDSTGLLRLRGAGTEVREGILEVGLPSPEATYPILRDLEAAGLRSALRRAELVQRSDFNGIAVDRRQIVDAETLERVWTMRGRKGLELLATLGRFPDPETEASTWASAGKIVASWRTRTQLPASMILLVDPARGDLDRDSVREVLGVEHLRLVQDAEIRQAPLGDWVKAADFVLVLGEPLEHPAVAALVDRQFGGERKDWNKATARVMADSIVWHRDALLALVERRGRYKALDNARMETALGQNPERATDAVPEIPPAAGDSPVPVVEPAPEGVSVGQAVASSFVEPVPEEPETAPSFQTEETSPMTETVVAAEPTALTDPVDSGRGREESATPITPIQDPAWPAPEEVPTDMEVRALGIYSEELEAEMIAGGVRSIDWSRMIADLAARKGDAEWDSSQCCVAAREWIKAENPVLWTESMHFRFRVAENPVDSPTIRQRGEHHIVGFADRMVIDPWAGLHLPGKPFWFDYEDERHRSILKKLYGDPRLWDLYDLVVENERGIALPEPTEVVSERQILLALDTIQRAPQWKVMDHRDAERWLARAVDVVTQERRGLERMADSGWIPVREEDRAAILSQDRLLFQTMHALYTSASAMGDLLSPSGQMRLWRQQLLKELPAMKGMDLLRGTLHEPAILAEVDRRFPSWERVRALQWPSLAADLAETMPEILVHMDALYRESQGERTVWHIVDAKSPRTLPDEVDENYLVQLNCYGEGLRRVLASAGTEDPEIHLHLAYGVLAEGRTHLVEVPQDPDLVARLLEAQDDLARAVVLGLPPVAELRPMPAEREEEHCALLARYETLRIEQDAVESELEKLQERIIAQQKGFAPVAWLDAEGRPRVGTRQAAPTLRAQSEAEWFQLAAGAGVDPTRYERDTYDIEAMRAALAERGIDVEAFRNGKELDVNGLKTAIKAAGGIAEVEWPWRIDLAQTKAAKEARAARLQDMLQARQDRYGEPLEVPAAPVATTAKRDDGPVPAASESIPQNPIRSTPASPAAVPQTDHRGDQPRSPRKP